MYYDPYLRPPSIPGQLPGTYPLPPDPASYSEPVTAPIPEIVPEEPEVTFYPEPRMIISLPEPAREPPAIGASREEVLARYGEPLGRITVRGQAQETLFFRGGVKVVLEGGKVIRTR
jgi:hypothetical protein